MMNPMFGNYCLCLTQQPKGLKDTIHITILLSNDNFEFKSFSETS
jgi:hypothetical protein